MATLLQWGLVNGISVTVLAVGVALVGKLVRRPALIHALWIVVLVKVLTPPIVRLSVEVPLPAQAALFSAERLEAAFPSHTASGAGGHTVSARRVPGGQSSVALHGADIADPAIAIPGAIATFCTQALRDAALWLWTGWAACSQQILALLAVTWFGGTLIWCGRQLAHAWSFGRILEAGEPASARIVWHAERLARSMGLSSIPQIIMVSHVVSPMLCSIGPRTRLVLPRSLLTRLDEEAVRTLLAHELAHYARGDNWVRLLELLSTALFWWHPVVWWARREIEISEEECCDAWVVGEFPNGSRTYAEALLATIDFLSDAPVPFPPAATGVAQVPFLRRRLTQIMRGVAPKALSIPGRLSVVLLASCLIPFHPSFTRPQPAPIARSQSKPPRAQPVRANPAPAPRSVARLSALPARQSERVSFPPVVEPPVRAPAVLAIPQPALPDPVPSRPGAPAATPWAIAVSCDGRFQITRRSQGAVSLYDSEADRTTDLSRSQILSVAFSPDGRLFATGGIDHLLRLWDAETGETLATFHDHLDTIPTLAFTPDGRWLISGGRDGDVLIWDVARNDRARALRLRQTPIDSLAVSRDGRWLAVATDNRFGMVGGRVTIRDLATLSERQSISAGSQIGAIAFHEDGVNLVVGETNGRITFWNIHSGQPTAGGFVPPDVIESARFSADTHALSRIDPSSVLPAVAPQNAPPILSPVVRDIFGQLPPAALEGPDWSRPDGPPAEFTRPRAHGG